MRFGPIEISFRAKPESKAVESSPPTQPMAAMSSLLYRYSDFRHYNPDDLIIRHGYSTYKKMMRDEQIKAVFRFRRNSITGRRYYIEFDEEMQELLGEKEVELRTKVVTKALESVNGNFRRSLNKVLLSMVYGFSLSEKVYKEIQVDGKTWWGLDEVLRREADTIEFEIETTGQLKQIVQCIGSKRTTLDPSRFIHHVHNPEEDDFYGLSELRECYRAWWSKDVVHKLRNIFLERMAGGFVWVKPSDTGNMSIPPGSQIETDILNVLNSLTTNSGVIFPKGLDVNIVQPKDCRGFEEALVSYDKSIAKAGLMPNLLGISEQGEHGALAQSETQLEAFLWMLDTEADDLCATINEQLIQQIVSFNFGDELYPTFRLRPLSKAFLQKVIDTWSKLVQAGAAEASDTDEEYLREQLEIPKKGNPLRKKTEVDPVTGLPKREDPVTEKDTGDEDGAEKPKDKTADEEVLGKGVVRTSKKASRSVSLARAVRRVDFVALDTSSTVAQRVHVDAVADLVARIVRDMVGEVRTNDALVRDPEAVTKLRVKASQGQEMRATINKMLKDGWELGISHGARELDRAKRTTHVTSRFSNEHFSIKFASVADIAAKYFAGKSFTMTGKLTTDLQTTIQNVLFNSIKYSKGTDETVAEIYRTLAQKGMLDPDDVEGINDLLADALEYANPLSRIETTVKTSYFEAINEARFGLFTDSDMNGFVTGLQYSAILDDRTTDICAELDGVALPADSDEWDRLRPPNHFNCRSILVAVTPFDDVVVSDEAPNVEPQEGFK